MVAGFSVRNMTEISMKTKREISRSPVRSIQNQKALWAQTICSKANSAALNEREIWRQVRHLESSSSDESTHMGRWSNYSHEQFTVREKVDTFPRRSHALVCWKYRRTILWTRTILHLSGILASSWDFLKQDSHSPRVWDKIEIPFAI